MEINIFEKTGEFAEDKDVARSIRINEIMPSLNKREDVILNFSGVNSATQSFIHALISEVIRKKTIDILDRIEFKNCNDTLKKIIGIVTDYMQKPT
jgi:hypothetical protein